MRAGSADTADICNSSSLNTNNLPKLRCSIPPQHLSVFLQSAVHSDVFIYITHDNSSNNNFMSNKSFMLIEKLTCCVLSESCWPALYMAYSCLRPMCGYLFLNP